MVDKIERCSFPDMLMISKASRRPFHSAESETPEMVSLPRLVYSKSSTSMLSRRNSLRISLSAPASSW